MVFMAFVVRILVLIIILAVPILFYRVLLYSQEYAQKNVGCDKMKCRSPHDADRRKSCVGSEDAGDECGFSPDEYDAYDVAGKCHPRYAPEIPRE